MAYTSEAPFQIRRHIQFLNGVNTETIGGTKQLTVSDSTYQFLNGGALSRDVELPGEDDGIYFWLKNTGSSNTLVVKDVSAATIITLAVGVSALVVCDGAAWAVMMTA